MAQRSLLGQWFWRNTAAYGVKGKAGLQSAPSLWAGQPSQLHPQVGGVPKAPAHALGDTLGVEGIVPGPLNEDTQAGPQPWLMSLMHTPT